MGINAERTDFFETVSERASDTLKRADSSFDEKSKRNELFTTHLKSPLATPRTRDEVHYSSHVPAQRPTADHHPHLLSLWPSTNINQLNSLRRAWNWINTQQASAKTTTFWLVLISTSSSAADFVKHAHRNVLSLALPIFIGPFLRLARLLLDSHIIYYGRPLWKTFNSGSLWVMANHKLMGGEDFAIRKTAHCFSILASRLALSLSPTESPNSELFARQKQFVDSTVDRHMRIVTHVTSEGVMHVESPSEPVLAIAASNIMLAPYLQSAENARGYTYADILKKFQQECLLNPDVALLKGSFGELASRIILMVACDAVKRKKIEQTEPKESSDTQHVGASIYAKPVISTGSSLMVHPPMPSNITLEPREGERHAARYMTYIAWEAKNRRDPQSTTVPASSAPVVAGPVIKSASMAPPNEKPLTEQALLIVLFDLGTSTGFKKAQDGSRPQVTPITGQQCPRLCIRGLLGPHAYPCLDLFEARLNLGGHSVV
ncbi:uncharacterized protein UMAG_06514 [Mycosarcoma maydis]|uniref:Uncharacterized protein n=1 Tax=Mycosarcoma maydis TaxID=5270 RepID=A0A0D1DNN1_MYCMD|nr:uncharacterized protein UMAG_06514 [Ustilago maydis 521]KIS65646.1 hypothetical protein UMAG_06514 [Ustilago maydis 521]|eukprot:XP_011392771.1 hypothetical protein UMAG_06514 [Ustilago maydis 521]